MSPRTIAQMNPVAVDWRNYQTVLWTRETSCVERDVVSARATSQMVFTTRAKARISSEVLATRLRSAAPGIKLPKVRIKIQIEYDIFKKKVRAKAKGNPQDPSIPLGLRRSLEIRPMRWSLENGGIHGATM